MVNKRILLADNDQEYLAQMTAALKRSGYRVEKAATPDEARRIIDSGLVAMAILDLRLKDNLNKRDISGLDVARETSGAVPKIIVSAYRPEEAMIVEALQPGPDGISPAVRFVLKNKGEDAILKAVRDTIRLPRFRQGLDELWNYIFESHEAAQQQAASYFRLSLGMATAGGLVIFLGLILVFMNQIPPGLYAAAMGALVDAAGFLVYRQANAATRRADRFHDKLLAMRYIENLLEACQEYEVSEEVRAHVLRSAVSYWLGPQAEMVNEQGK